MNGNWKAIRLIFLIIGTTCIGYFSWGVYQAQNQKRELQEALIELSDIKYGMFNVDEWTNILSDIVAKKVENFDLTEENREELHKRVSAFLHTTIDDFEARFYSSNRGVSGFFRNSVASLTNLFKELKDDVPIFTEEIVNFLDEAENKEQLRAYIVDQLSVYAGETFSEMNYGVKNQILAIHGYPSGEAAIEGLGLEIEALEQKNDRLSTTLFATIFVLGIATMLLKNPSVPEFSLLTLACFCLLLGGISLPMINIDARISEMNFSLLGESIQFKDQVLYFKSKSIIEIVQLMLSQGKTDVLMVGLLVLLFSVLFPMLKLINSVIYLYSEGSRSNKFVRFMVFKTGKWSMADVLVIAIFMSYIGFSGVLNEQLGHLGNLSQSVEMLTTNQTSLELGFFLFTAFVVMSLLISHQMESSKKLE